jgi:hypothetical protein
VLDQLLDVVNFTLLLAIRKRGDPPVLLLMLREIAHDLAASPRRHERGFNVDQSPSFVHAGNAEF